MEQQRWLGQDHSHVPFGAEIRHQTSRQDHPTHRHVSPVRPLARSPRRRRAHALRLCQSAVHAQERAYANR